MMKSRAVRMAVAILHKEQNFCTKLIDVII